MVIVFHIHQFKNAVLEGNLVVEADDICGAAEAV